MTDYFTPLLVVVGLLHLWNPSTSLTVRMGDGSNNEWIWKKFLWLCPHEVSFKNFETFIDASWTSAELRALSSPPTTPLKGDASLSRSQSSSAKVKRRSRSKSPFRSFRWKRSSTANEQEQSDEDEGISFLISYTMSQLTRHKNKIVMWYDWWNK